MLITHFINVDIGADVLRVARMKRAARFRLELKDKSRSVDDFFKRDV